MAESLQAGGKGDTVGERTGLSGLGAGTEGGDLVAEVSLSVLAVIFPLSPQSLLHPLQPLHPCIIFQSHVAAAVQVSVVTRHSSVAAWRRVLKDWWKFLEAVTHASLPHSLT